MVGSARDPAATAGCSVVLQWHMPGGKGREILDAKGSCLGATVGEGRCMDF